MVDFERNMMGGPRSKWPLYVNLLGVVGAGVAIVAAFAVLAVIVSPSFWIGSGATLVYGVVGWVLLRRARPT